MFLICSFIMISDIVHFFSSTRWPFICSFQKNIHSDLVPIFIELFLSCFLFVFAIEFLSCTHSFILDFNSLTDTLFANIFSHYLSCPFKLFIISFAMIQTLFDFLIFLLWLIGNVFWTWTFSWLFQKTFSCYWFLFSYHCSHKRFLIWFQSVKIYFVAAYIIKLGEFSMCV
jgi:hypothetical protein